MSWFVFVAVKALKKIQMDSKLVASNVCMGHKTMIVHLERLHEQMKVKVRKEIPTLDKVLFSNNFY